MLIYIVGGQNAVTESRKDNAVPCTDSSNLNSLKLIVECLSKSKCDDIKSTTSAYCAIRNEDNEAYCVTLIKHLLRIMDLNILNSYEASKVAFPLLQFLHEYSHHRDTMLKNAARISLMTILQKCHGNITEHITLVTIPRHMNAIILHLKLIALKTQNFYEKPKAAALRNIFLSYQEELEYIDDILRINHSSKKIGISTLLKDFIAPFIFMALTNEKREKYTTSPLSYRIGLCLLSKTLQVITDSDMKDCIIRHILQEQSITERNNCEKVMDSLLLILMKSKSSADTVITLQILHALQIHILKSCAKNYDEFCHIILPSLIKLLKIHLQFSPHMKCLQMKLLISLLNPLVHRTITYNTEQVKLQEVLFKSIEILYFNICEKIRHISHLVDVINEEYETFTNIVLDRNMAFNAVNYLFEDNKAVNNAEDNIKIMLYHLFCIRHLLLESKNREETCLPTIRRKEKIGKVMLTDNSIPCKKLICNNIYDDDHFLKLTDRQLLVLQSTKSPAEGVIVFNPYYKDICLSIHSNNILKIYETHYSNSKPFFIQLQFLNMGGMQFVAHALPEAKLYQTEYVNRKLNELFQL